MPLTLAQLLGEHWQSYIAANRTHLCTAHYRAVRSVLSCRTPALGGQVYQCAGCHRDHYAYHSCNHRNCPACGARDTQEWTAKQEARLLPAPYFLITFTIPEPLRTPCKTHPAELYNLLLKESAGALQDILQTKLGAEGGGGGFTSILHTWTRQLQHHPHIHIIIPGATYDKKTRTLKHPAKPDFLVHGNALAARFKNRLEIALKQQHPDIHKTLTPTQTKTFSAGTKGTSGTGKTNTDTRNKWVVDVRHVGQGKSALRYLARYVKRSAFSAKNLLGYDRHGNVQLRWTNSQTNRVGILKLHPHELIRRWLLHVLPKGFTRVRHYGYLAGAAKRTRLRVRALLGELGEPAPNFPEQEPFRCDHCQGELKLTGKLERTRPRGPPTWKYIPKEDEEKPGGEGTRDD